jgi:hypothetical protein
MSEIKIKAKCGACGSEDVFYFENCFEKKSLKILLFEVARGATFFLTFSFGIWLAAKLFKLLGS